MFLIRCMKNYYDTIQLLTIYNINNFKPHKLEIEMIRKDIEDIPNCINNIVINMSVHPYENIINDTFNNGKIVGLESEFLDNINMSNHEIEKIEIGIWKDKKISNNFKRKNYDCLLYGSKNVAWTFLEKISFNIIILETVKNIEQLDSIILRCRNNKYKKMDNMYINEKFIKEKNLYPSHSS